MSFDDRFVVKSVDVARKVKDEDHSGHVLPSGLNPGRVVVRMAGWMTKSAIRCEQALFGEQ